MLLFNLFADNSIIQIWYILIGLVAFCFFLVCLITCIILTVKKKTKTIPVILTIIFLATYLSCIFIYDLSNTGEFGYILDPSTGFSKLLDIMPVYKNKDGEEVVYDKSGKEYTFKEYKKGFKYYGADGNEYILETTNADSQIQVMICKKTGEKYTVNRISDCSFLIDEDGLLYDFEGNIEIEEVYNERMQYYEDENGKRYFEWIYVGWDENGNMFYFDTQISELSKYDLVDDFVG